MKSSGGISYCPSSLSPKLYVLHDAFAALVRTHEAHHNAKISHVRIILGMALLTLASSLDWRPLMRLIQCFGGGPPHHASKSDSTESVAPGAGARLPVSGHPRSHTINAFPLHNVPFNYQSSEKCSVSSAFARVRFWILQRLLLGIQRVTQDLRCRDWP